MDKSVELREVTIERGVRVQDTVSKNEGKLTQLNRVTLGLNILVRLTDVLVQKVYIICKY